MTRVLVPCLLAALPALAQPAGPDPEVGDHGSSESAGRRTESRESAAGRAGLDGGHMKKLVLGVPVLALALGSTTGGRP